MSEECLAMCAKYLICLLAMVSDSFSADACWYTHLFGLERSITVVFTFMVLLRSLQCHESSLSNVFPAPYLKKIQPLVESCWFLIVLLGCSEVVHHWWCIVAV